MNDFVFSIVKIACAEIKELYLFKRGQNEIFFMLLQTTKVQGYFLPCFVEINDNKSIGTC